MSLYWAMTRPKSVAGIIALSTWLPCNSRFPAEFKGNSDTNCFIGHGTKDPLVGLSWAKESHDIVRKILPNTIYKLYDGLDHQLLPEEIDQVQEFISSRLP